MTAGRAKVIPLLFAGIENDSNRGEPRTRTPPGQTGDDPGKIFKSGLPTDDVPVHPGGVPVKPRFVPE